MRARVFPIGMQGTVDQTAQDHLSSSIEPRYTHVRRKPGVRSPHHRRGRHRLAGRDRARCRRHARQSAGDTRDAQRRFKVPSATDLRSVHRGRHQLSRRASRNCIRLGRSMESGSISAATTPTPPPYALYGTRHHPRLAATLVGRSSPTMLTWTASPGSCSSLLPPGTGLCTDSPSDEGASWAECRLQRFARTMVEVWCSQDTLRPLGSRSNPGRSDLVERWARGG